MKILVTGGAGFIGSNLCDVLIDAGHEVAVVDNLSTGYRQNLNPKARFYEMDICDEALKDVFEQEKPDVVDHHAAQISVPLSIEDPQKDAEINVKGLINVLECSVRTRVQKFIYISSGGAMYGEAEQYPTPETYAPSPLSMYGINKLVGEYYLHFYHQQYGLKYTTLRYANVYGPRQVSHGEAGVVAIFVEKLLAGETPTICAYADNPEGMIRDYVFVEDVVQANILALYKGDNQAFNIGTMTETTTSALYHEICRQLKINTIPHQAPARKGDLQRSLLNCDKAKRELGWEPKYTLAMGISHVIHYFQTMKEANI